MIPTRPRHVDADAEAERHLITPDQTDHPSPDQDRSPAAAL
jgi:hypothetical protein